MSMRRARRQTRRVGPWLAGTVIVIAVLGVGGLGWHWTSTLQCERVEVTGTLHAPPEAILDLARVDTGGVLFDVDPDLVADRVRRHPWVMAAEVTRFPTGTLSVHVYERRPVVLVLDGAGRASHYLDAAGYAMPLTGDAVYDVPVLHGFDEPYHPVRRVQDPQVRGVLAALGAAGAETDALVSEVELRDETVWIRTTPLQERASVPVRLGRTDYGRKLDVLQAFWRQAVLTQPTTTFEWIDLRFDSQVVTREGTHDEQPAIADDV